MTESWTTEFEETSCRAKPPLSRIYGIMVPPNSIYFRGHFPEEPILPAVVQLDGLILARVETAWADLGALRRATKLKFHRPIRPGHRIELHLVRSPRTSRVEFSISDSEGLLSSGTLWFEEGR